MIDASNQTWDDNALYVLAKKALIMYQIPSAENDLLSHKYAVNLAAYHEIRSDNTETKDDWMLYAAAERLMKYVWHFEEYEFILSISEQNMLMGHAEQLYQLLSTLLESVHDDVFTKKVSESKNTALYRFLNPEKSSPSALESKLKSSSITIKRKRIEKNASATIEKNKVCSKDKTAEDSGSSNEVEACGDLVDSTVKYILPYISGK